MFARGKHLYEVTDGVDQCKKEINIIHTFDEDIKNFVYFARPNAKQIVVYTVNKKFHIINDDNNTEVITHDGEFFSDYNPMWYSQHPSGNYLYIVYPDSIVGLSCNSSSSWIKYNLGTQIDSVIRSNDWEFHVILVNGEIKRISLITVDDCFHVRRRLGSIDDNTTDYSTMPFRQVIKNDGRDVVKMLPDDHLSVLISNGVLTSNTMLVTTNIRNIDSYYSHRSGGRYIVRYLALTFDNKMKVIELSDDNLSEEIILDDATKVMLPMSSTYDYDLTNQVNCKSARNR